VTHQQEPVEPPTEGGPTGLPEEPEVEEVVSAGSTTEAAAGPGVEEVVSAGSTTEAAAGPGGDEVGSTGSTTEAAAGPWGDEVGSTGSTTEDATEPTAEQDELTVTQIALAERTADLQRLQAEYLNYKRRVERDRELIRENATYAVLGPIIDVLDTIDRAREHGPLEDGFKAVADQLERVVAGLGLTKFGEAGDEFDPTIHEALSHIGVDPEVKVPTAKVVAKAGYKIGHRVVRAAQVLVVDPPEETD
jgi:molecular chaperone GrpE